MAEFIIIYQVPSFVKLSASLNQVNIKVILGLWTEYLHAAVGAIGIALILGMLIIIFVTVIWIKQKGENNYLPVHT